jgi:hypothetical protein
MSEERQTSTEGQPATGRTGRREALKQMGQYAAYTAPTLIALTLPQEAAAAKRGRGVLKRLLGGGRKVARGGGGGRSPRPHVSRG